MSANLVGTKDVPGGHGEDGAVLDREKQEFLRHNPSYGYGGRIDAIFHHELSDRLQNSVYFDHGGAGVYTSTQLSASHEFLSRALLLNPHTDASTSSIIDGVREQVLQYVGASSKTHSLVFVSNTSAAMRLVAETFPFGAESELAMTMDNHNSAIGMREKIKACGPGARYSVSKLSEGEPAMNEDAASPLLQCCCSPALLAQHDALISSPPAPASSSPLVHHPCLFVFPGESNFDGRLYDLDLAEVAHAYNAPLDPTDTAAATRAAQTRTSNPLQFHHTAAHHRWYTMVDASKLLSTSRLDLSRHAHVDFATISFYKMFGYPTGIAALIIRNEAADELWGPRAHLTSSGRRPPLSALSSRRGYFAGGTVNAVIADEDFFVSKTSGKLHELLEDGTLAFTSIVAVPYGIALFRTLGPDEIHRHATALAEYLFEWMRDQRYESTDRPVCLFYGERAVASRASTRRSRFGPTLNFNFLDESGQVIGYKTVEKIATVNRIFIRSGSFCNPGACQMSYPLSGAQIRANLSAGYACWEDGENLGGVVNGSIRVSLGWCTRWEDLARFMQFVRGEIMHIGRQTFVSTQQANGSNHSQTTTNEDVQKAIETRESVASPLAFQLPAYFHTPTSVAAPLAASTESSVAPESTPSLIPPPPPAVSPLPYPLPSSPYVLSSLTVYPIKSCGGLSLPSWFIRSTSTGSTLFLDREFVLLDAYSMALSQKTLPKLQLITPTIDLRAQTLTLDAKGKASLVIPLGTDDAGPVDDQAVARVASLCELQVCGQSSLGYVYDAPHHAHITEWLTDVVGKYTCLARKSPTLSWPKTTPASNKIDFPSSGAAGASTPLQPAPAVASSPAGAPRPSFANEDDFLLVNAASVREAQRRLHEYTANHKILTPHANDAVISPARFRPNFVFDSAKSVLSAFAEDGWSSVTIGPFTLSVQGGCGRCTMVNVHPETGDRTSSLYALLNTCRKQQNGRVIFGSLLSNLQHDAPSQVPQERDDEGSSQWYPIHIGMPCSARDKSDA